MNTQTAIHTFWQAFWLLSFLRLAFKSVALANANPFASNRYFAIAYAFGIVTVIVCG